MPLDSKLRKNCKKITEYTTIQNSNVSKKNIESICAHTNKPQKRPISPNQLNKTITSKRPKSELCVEMDDNSVLNPSSSLSGPNGMDGNDCDKLQKALSPLMNEFKSLRDSVKSDYNDLKHTITKQKEELQKELIHKIDSNTKQLSSISEENKLLRKENTELKSRLDTIEQNQLRNNVLVSGIQEGPYEQYNTTKLRIQEIIAVTINSGNAVQDLETAKGIEIIDCKRLGKYRNNYSRPISVTFATRDDKEMFLSNKRTLPDGVYANKEFPIHIKRNRDRLRPILRLAKSLPQYREKSKMVSDKLIINGVSYGIDNIHTLPPELAAYKAAEKSNETHLVFAGELSPYSNLHKSPFKINGQEFHSSEQWIQYQKALAFGDSYTANVILQTESALDCKQLSYKIKGVDIEKWCNEGYDLCFDGVKEKFVQNPPLLALLKSTTPKTLAEATLDRLWGTGIALRDTNALDTGKWNSTGWLSKMLLAIRDDP